MLFSFHIHLVSLCKVHKKSLLYAQVASPIAWFFISLLDSSLPFFLYPFRILPSLESDILYRLAFILNSIWTLIRLETILHS